MSKKYLTTEHVEEFTKPTKLVVEMSGNPLNKSVPKQPGEFPMAKLAKPKLIIEKNEPVKNPFGLVTDDRNPFHGHIVYYFPNDEEEEPIKSTAFKTTKEGYDLVKRLVKEGYISNEDALNLQFDIDRSGLITYQISRPQ